MKVNETESGRLVIKSMVITLCVVALILIGYFGTGYFFGEM